MTRHVIEIGYEAEATAIAMECRVVQGFSGFLCHACRRAGAQAIPFVNQSHWVGAKRREPLSIEQELTQTLKPAKNSGLSAE
ncbi:MAG: hypothetical protein OEQ90_11195, partial [Gammaproteobacteria bacterium]|nr:hypothetical protein [Gammaproteobacteria bacterium]